MYTLFNTNPIWSLNPGPVGQACYETTPNTPLAMNAPPTVSQASNQPVYPQMQSSWYAPVDSSVPSRPWLLNDEVFVPEWFVYDNRVYRCLVPCSASRLYKVGNSGVHVSQEMSQWDGGLYKQPVSVSPPTTSSRSPELAKENSSSGYNTSPESFRHKRLGHTLNSLSPSSNSNSNSNSSSPKSHKHDDSLLHTFFPASLCAALNDDSSEPDSLALPLRTSSPIRGDRDSEPVLIDITNLRKRRGHFVTSSSSEKSPRFSENGVCDDLDLCDQIIIQSREQNAEEKAAKKREEFLLILEAERERQRKLILPKHASRLSCKFCKNNGESPDVYTKHRLRCNEKTVCPLLRHYVCRLCNSTGDFAHTIRYCPFNDRKDKIAWKATFLV